MNPDPRHLRSSYKWLVVAMLWFVCFFNYADRQAIFSVFPLLKQQLQLTDVQLGVVGASFMWMYAFFGPFAGWLSDRLPRKTLVLGALIFWSFATAATALCHSYPQLVLCRALGGLGEAFYFPAAMSLIGDYHGSATRSRAMSLHQSAVYAGSIAGGAVSGFMGQYYGWSASFLFFGGSGIVLGFILWGLLDEPERGLSEPAPILQQTCPANRRDRSSLILHRRFSHWPGRSSSQPNGLASHLRLCPARTLSQSSSSRGCRPSCTRSST